MIDRIQNKPLIGSVSDEKSTWRWVNGSLVSLVILAIAVLGFAALQFRALDAIQEANDRTAAMTLARELAEKIRVNRTQLSKYKSRN